ncbi:hypothetical protein GE09DRAFT_1250860 [Coniochaeta sp. 2T2.1]|nr:hypothetical protein GE09DRAFT_1250860 [Coniochaeta sp. 2T2.1]
MSSSTSANLPRGKPAQEGTTTPTVPCSSTATSPTPGTTTRAIRPTMDSPPETTAPTTQPHGDSPGNLTVTSQGHVTEDDPLVCDEIIGGVFRLNSFNSQPWVHAPAADLGKTKITWRILDAFLQNLPEDGQEALLRDLMRIMLPTMEEEPIEEEINWLFEMRWPSSKSGRTKRNKKIKALMEKLERGDMEKLERLTALKDKLVGMMGFINPTSLIHPDHARKTACLDRDYNTCVITRTEHDDEAERYDPPNVVDGECRWQSTDEAAPVYTEAVYIFNPKIIASFDWDTLKRYFPQVYEQLDEYPLCQESNIITMRGDLVDDFVNFRFALKPITDDLANRWHAFGDPERMDEMTFDALEPKREAYLEGICPDTIKLLPRVDPEKWKVVAPATRPELLNLHRTMARINNILERKIPQWRTGGVDEWEEVDDDEKPKGRDGRGGARGKGGGGKRDGAAVYARVV